MTLDENYQPWYGSGDSGIVDKPLASDDFDNNEIGMQSSFQQPPSYPTDVGQAEATKNQGVDWGAWTERAATGAFNLGAAAFAKNQGLTAANGGQSVPRKNNQTGRVYGDGTTNTNNTQTAQPNWLPLAVLGGLAYAVIG